MGAVASNCLEGVQCVTGPPRPKELVLKYFPFAGRAEPIRLSLRLGRLPFSDQRIKAEVWEGQKKEAPHGQLPVLLVDGQQLSQTKAILRYIGRLAFFEGKPLYPRDALAAARTDEILEAFDDLWILVSSTYLLRSPHKEHSRADLFSPQGEGAARVQIFDRLLAASADGYVVPGGHLTIADLLLFCFFNVLRSGFVEGIEPDTFSRFDAVSQHLEMVARISAVRSYYESEALSNPEGSPHYAVFLPSA